MMSPVFRGGATLGLFVPMCFLKPERKALVGFNAQSRAMECRHNLCGVGLYILTLCPASPPQLPSFRDRRARKSAMLSGLSSTSIRLEHGLILFRRHHVGPAANSHGKLDAKNKNALALSAEVAAWLETSAATPVIV
jgi:hypothetical protein